MWKENPWQPWIYCRTYMQTIYHSTTFLLSSINFQHIKNLRNTMFLIQKVISLENGASQLSAHRDHFQYNCHCLLIHLHTLWYASLHWMQLMSRIMNVSLCSLNQDMSVYPGIFLNVVTCSQYCMVVLVLGVEY